MSRRTTPNRARRKDGLPPGPIVPKKKPGKKPRKKHRRFPPGYQKLPREVEQTAPELKVPTNPFAGKTDSQLIEKLETTLQGALDSEPELMAEMGKRGMELEAGVRKVTSSGAPLPERLIEAIQRVMHPRDIDDLPLDHERFGRL